MILINTTTKTNTLHNCYAFIVAYKNNHLHPVYALGKAFVFFYHLPLKFLYIHRHITDDLGLDLQVGNGFMVDNDHKKHFLALILNVL